MTDVESAYKNWKAFQEVLDMSESLGLSKEAVANFAAGAVYFEDLYRKLQSGEMRLEVSP